MGTWEIGNIDNSEIGQTTPSKGAFTELKASTDPVDNHGIGDRGYNDIRYVMPENALMKVSSTTVAFDAVAAVTLYTVPAGKLFVPVFAIVRVGADAVLTDLTFGRSTAKTDWLGTTQLDNLDADGDQALLMPVPQDPPLKLKTYAAGVIFQIDVIVAQGGSSNMIDLFGYNV